MSRFHRFEGWLPGPISGLMGTNQSENTVVNKQPDGEKSSGEGCRELGRIKDMAGKQTTQMRKDGGINNPATQISSYRKLRTYDNAVTMFQGALKSPAILFCLTVFLFCADLFADQPGSTLQFTGESVYYICDKDGKLTASDTNQFIVIVRGCAWNMTLIPTVAPEQPTQIADDGDNYYVLAKGPGMKGTTKVGQKMMEYVDSASIYEVRRTHPKRHGVALWLSLASSCEMSSPRGEITGIEDLGYRIKDAPISYEAVIDKTKNSVGPSVLRLTQPVTLTNTEIVFLESELKVKASSQEGAVFFPTVLEFRGFVYGQSGAQARDLFVYKLAINACKVLPGHPDIRPNINSATSIADYRFPNSFEYVASHWVGKDEALSLLKSGSVRRYSSPEPIVAPRQSGRLTVLVVLLLTLICGALLVFQSLRKK